MASPESSVSKSKSPSLIRALGPQMALAVVVGNVIGSGIFLKPATIASESGNFWIIISIWILGGGLCILGALCFAELATMLPRAGGLYVYLREAYGQPIAFLFGWTEFLVRVPGSIAALSVVFVDQLVMMWGLDGYVPVAGRVTLVAVVILSLAWVNMMGVLWGGQVQLWTTVVKAGVLALVALAPLLFAPFVASSIQLANYSSTVTPESPTLSAQIGAVLLAVMWAYNGWHGITPLAEEVREPQRNIPYALFGGVGILVALYVAANVAYHGVLSMDEMAEVAHRSAAGGQNPAGATAAAEMLNRLMGRAGITLVAAVIMCSSFGALNTNLLNSPRITFAMGRDGVFFRGLGKVHATRRTPAAAIIVTALMAIGLVSLVAIGKAAVRDVDASVYHWEVTREIVKSLQEDSTFNLITNSVIFAASVFYTLAVSSVIILRYRLPDRERPYRTLGYPFVPLAFIAIYVWFLWQVYRSNPLETRFGVVFIAAGIPVYFLYRQFGRHKGNGD